MLGKSEDRKRKGQQRMRLLDGITDLMDMSLMIGRTDAEAPILWLPNSNNLLIGKDPDAGKD